mmetsp:Transcript_573/g.576  ORF Transcript_573/g.576 Transcript_573/m.576 type:complete len:149 (-) Transcript_573:280-726(-)
MISQTFTVSAFEARNEVKPAPSPDQINTRVWNSSFLRPAVVSKQTIDRARPLQGSYMSSPNQEAHNFGKPSSVPNGFLSEFSSNRNHFEEDSSLNSLSSQTYEEDTDSDYCSREVDEDELVNEMKSKNDADDELASLFESDNSAASEP